MPTCTPATIYIYLMLYLRDSFRAFLCLSSAPRKTKTATRLLSSVSAVLCVQRGGAALVTSPRVGSCGYKEGNQGLKHSVMMWCSGIEHDRWKHAGKRKRRMHKYGRLLSFCREQAYTGTLSIWRSHAGAALSMDNKENVKNTLNNQQRSTQSMSSEKVQGGWEDQMRVFLPSKRCTGGKQMKRVNIWRKVPKLASGCSGVWAKIHLEEMFLSLKQKHGSKHSPVWWVTRHRFTPLTPCPLKYLNKDNTSLRSFALWLKLSERSL